MICAMMQLLPKALNANLILRLRDYARTKLILRTEINCLVARYIIIALSVGGICHVVTKSDGQDISVLTFEERKVEAEESSRPTDKQVRFCDAIDTVEKSRSRFSKRDQLRADRVRRFQHVAAFLEDSTM